MQVAFQRRLKIGRAARGYWLLKRCTKSVISVVSHERLSIGGVCTLSAVGRIECFTLQTSQCASQAMHVRCTLYCVYLLIKQLPALTDQHVRCAANCSSVVRWDVDESSDKLLDPVATRSDRSDRKGARSSQKRPVVGGQMICLKFSV